MNNMYFITFSNPPPCNDLTRARAEGAPSIAIYLSCLHFTNKILFLLAEKIRKIYLFKQSMVQKGRNANGTTTAIHARL